MNKKAITILGAIFLLIVGTLGVLIYQRRSSTTTTPPPPPVTVTPTPTPTPTPEPTPPPVDPNPTPTPTPTPPPGGQGSLSVLKVTDDEVISPVLFYQGNGIAYFNSQGQLFQADLDSTSGQIKLTNKRELAVPAKGGVSKVIWPAAGNNYLVQTQNNFGQNVWSVYASDKGAYIDLPGQITAVNWMPDGEQLLYFWLEDGKTNLNISPVDLSTWQTITDIWENDNDLSISPDGKTILFWRKGNSGSSNAINLMTPDGKLFRSVVKEGFNQGGVWSPDSKKFAFNRKGPNGQLQLWVGNLFTGEVQNMSVETAVSEIMWSQDSKTLYVPSAANGVAQLVRIDVPTAASQVISMDTAASPTELFMTASGKEIFFKDKQGSGLYYVDISGVSVK
ncbi:MAG: PD40 domain-containing protein [Candidatus Doudnabacteria bacterium]|nr:PD40 domain-containing protein [Candidatus Doudnabacteria bacterium]